jgi:fructosamine-3-kinase
VSLARFADFRRSVASVTALSGGDLNQAFRAELVDGRTVFVKTSSEAAPGGFAAEAAGLAWIAAADGAPPVPEVVEVGVDYLALSWIEAGGRPRDDERFGRELAALHRAGAPGFGALPPGVAGGLRIGPLELRDSGAVTGGHGPNDGSGRHLPRALGNSWAQVYREQRLMPLVRQASERGALSPAGVAAVDRVAQRLEELAGPPEAPARLHGDLWSGNTLGNHLIDPAAYGGHREVDLAMMALFGGFGPRCFAAYDEVFALTDGWSERVGLWQLFPLLVHAVLFGGGYGARVEAIARRYSGSESTG